MEILLQQAAKLYNAGNKQQAAKLLSNLITQEPNNENAWFGLALCLEDNDKKKYCLEKVLKIDPNHVKAQQALGRISNLNEYVLCPFCSKSIRGDVLFCSYCGRQLSDVSIAMNQDIQFQEKNDNPQGFQPRFISAVAGAGIVIGTFLPWIIITQGGKTLYTMSGIITLPGMFTFLAGGTIALTSLLIKTKTNSPSAPIASLVSFIIFFLSCVLSFMVLSNSTEACFENIFGPNNVCQNSNFGGGFYFSMLCIVIASITGRIKNPN